MRGAVAPVGPLAPSSANGLVGGPGLCWPPRQPVAPGDALFCLRLEGTQQKKSCQEWANFLWQAFGDFPGPILLA